MILFTYHKAGYWNLFNSWCKSWATTV